VIAPPEKRMTTEADMDTEQKKSLVRRYYDELWSEGNVALARDLFTDDYENCDPATPGGVIKGRDAFASLVGTYREAFPDLRFRIVEQHVDGDTVISRWLSTGTHRGAMMGIPATGRSGKDVEGITISTFKGDRIARDRVVWDLFGLVRFLTTPQA
jgi:steroid delta-isomerase-like uncharacterized protein